jgi:hypothetical protein
MSGGFGVSAGSAAKDAERRARESEAVPFRSTVGIQVRRGGGQKFEIETRPSDPGGVRPEQPDVQPAPAADPAPPPSAAARLVGKFLSLFVRSKRK